MRKCKLCPQRKVCRDECYGDNPCSFAKAFDDLGKKLDRKTVSIESLRGQRDEAQKKVPEHRIIGEYVLTPVPNAFNGKTSWWLTKKGYVMALYCFTGTDQKEVEYQIENLDPYTRLLNECINAVRVNEYVYDIATMAQHLSEKGKIETEDSRELFGNIMYWAKEFEREHPGPWESREEEEYYIDAIDEFAEKKLLEKYGVLVPTPKKLLDTPANIAQLMIEDLGNGAMGGYDRWSNYFGLATSKDKKLQGEVMAALGESKHDLLEDEWYYTLHVINNVDMADCELYHTEHLSEEELVALLDDLMKKMEKGEM